MHARNHDNPAPVNDTEASPEPQPETKNASWQTADYSGMPESDAEFLREQGEAWHEAGRLMFEQMLRRGSIAEAVFERLPGRFTWWCQNVAKCSDETARNWRKVYREFHAI